MPLLGVFACYARLDDVLLPAAVNIGFRPTVQAEGIYAPPVKKHVEKKADLQDW